MADTSFGTFCALQQARILVFLEQCETRYKQRIEDLRLTLDAEAEHRGTWMPAVGDTEKAWINPNWEYKEKK